MRYMAGKVLWLVTARSGSKSIPDKNIKKLGEYPLLAYRIKTALTISEGDHVWCSTDSEIYASIAQQYGAKTPFIRPEELATDQVSSVDVVLHAMHYATEHGYQYDYLGLLEPTSPFVYYQDLIHAVKRLDETDEADAIVAVRESRPNTYFIQVYKEYLDDLSSRLGNSRDYTRQDFEKEITPSGGFYIAKWDKFYKQKTFYTAKTLAYLLPDECTIEIDEPVDWEWAEFLLNTTIDKKRLFK